MTTLLLADAWQLIGVLLMLAGAVGYLTIYYRRGFKGEAGGACGSNCGIPFKRLVNSKQPPEDPPANTGRPFVPAEDLADLAARRRKEQEKKMSG